MLSASVEVKSEMCIFPSAVVLSKAYLASAITDKSKPKSFGKVVL